MENQAVFSESHFLCSLDHMVEITKDDLLMDIFY